MKKYKVTQEFMDELEDWRDKFVNGEIPVNKFTAETRNNVVERWRFEHIDNGEIIKRLGALLNWINGEDVFEIGMPHYIVKRNGFNFFVGNEYLSLGKYGAINITRDKEKDTRFDDSGKAYEWSNAHFEVVEVDE